MKAKYSMYDIREALRKEIADALDEPWLSIEIPAITRILKYALSQP